MFDHIIGNEQAKAYLRRTAERRTVGNSLLFAGPDGIGKSLFAEAFAKLLICQNDPHGHHRHKIEAGNHPDIRIYRPEGKVGMHSIASMRNFNQEVYLAPFEAKWKVFIIHDADRMLTYSANSLLKTFEEPASDAVIILLSSAPAALLPTILSRCRTIHFQPIAQEEITEFISQRCGKPHTEASVVASMAQGSIGQALRLAKEGSHPLRSFLLDILSKRSFSSYKELSAAAASIAGHIETSKKEIEGDVRTLLMRGAGTDLSATQKQSIEKEIEGAVSMHATQEAHALLEVLLAWYRDMHLMQENGELAYLMHTDSIAACEHAFKAGGIQPLESVQKTIADARLSIERSTSLNICFENLFLKLNFL